MLVLIFLSRLVSIKILLKIELKKITPKKFSPTIRQFALSLHFYSVKAYVYVRNRFNTILPHPCTLSKWYRHINADLGFTEGIKA